MMYGYSDITVTVEGELCTTSAALRVRNNGGKLLKIAESQKYNIRVVFLKAPPLLFC